jgi:hypothetical protein
MSMQNKKPSWGISIFFLIVILGSIFRLFTSDSYEVRFEADRTGYELVDFGIIEKNLEKNDSFISSIEKIDFHFYVRRDGIYARDFQKIAFREFVFYSFLPLCVILGFVADWFSFSKRFDRARLILHLGIIFSAGAFIFSVAIYPFFLEKLIFTEIFQDRPYLTGGSHLDNLFRTFSTIFFFGLFIYSDRQVQKAQTESLNLGASNA